MQKEQLSALMDGETLDSELLNERLLPEMKTRESYHLIRDSMRGDTPGYHFDISSRVMAAGPKKSQYVNRRH